MVKRVSIKLGELLKNSGVYCIECIPTGKIYIGSAKDISKRWRSHKGELNRGTHTNIYFQNSWNKYGSEEFNFSVLEFCDCEERLQREQYYIDSFNACDRAVGFNIAEIAGAPSMTEETRKRQSESLKKNTEFIESSREFMLNLHKDPEQKQKLIDSVKNSDKVKETLERWNNSPEHKKQITELLKKIHSDPVIQQHVKNMASVNVNSDNWRATHGVKQIVQLNLDGIYIKTYNTIGEAVRDGYSKSTITRVCKRGINSKDLYKWMYKEDYDKLKGGD